jgi:hypothetical protein
MFEPNTRAAREELWLTDQRLHKMLRAIFKEMSLTLCPSRVNSRARQSVFDADSRFQGMT